MQAVSTCKVKAITEELRGHSFSATTISAINVKLNGGLAKSTRRRLDEVCPDLILDAHYERICARSATGRVAGAPLPTRALDSSVSIDGDDAQARARS
jgi:transposase-like protein